MDKLRVAVAAKWYPMSIAGYWLRALRRRDDLDIKTVGEWTGDRIPWGPNMRLKESAPHPDFLADQGTPFRAVEAQMRAQGWTPEVWLNIDAAWHLQGSASVPMYWIATDAHCIDYDRQRQLGTLFNMHPHYSKDGDIKLHYAYDRDQWTPDRNLDDVLYDVGMVGVMYQDRFKAVDHLRSYGLRVYVATGPIFEEYNQIYRQSFMALNWASLDDLAMRYFESKAFGCVSLDKRVPDMEKFWVDGTHTLGFSTLDELADRALWAMGNREDAKRIAEAGHESVKLYDYDYLGQLVRNKIFSDLGRQL